MEKLFFNFPKEPLGPQEFFGSKGGTLILLFSTSKHMMGKSHG